MPNAAEEKDISSPVLLTVPHAGRAYPAWLLAAARVEEDVLRKLEDRHADALVVHAAGQGHQALIASEPRALIDLNRAEDDLEVQAVAAPRDHLAFNPTIKARGGLGLIPDRLAHHGPLWRTPATGPEILDRISKWHQPWHDRIARALDARRERFGIAILLDIHSMPTLPRHRGQPLPPHVVVGDCHGRSSNQAVIDLVMAGIGASGLRVARNHPYSGGHTVQRHGLPKRGIHALQIEFDRSLYLDAQLDQPGPGLATIQTLVMRLADMLTEELVPAWPLAAE